ncbi:dihydrolipoyl dehydrogenase family protein [Streptomyces mirabilis]|uniref:dihydrolipoyl dehydrogenase family protein n=1 Tax=Streptomyces mirabilis TaxID=68239 RepID=UPI003797219E
MLVEAELLGGECSYWACMPSKVLLRPADVLGNAQHVPGVASLLTDHVLDVPATLARRDIVVNGLDDSSQIGWALGAGIDVVREYGRLDGERSVAVEMAAGGTRVLTARYAVVIDTGSCTTVPPIEGMTEARPWTSRDVTSLHEVPRRVVVLGGGVVACEAATWLRALGVAELSVVYRRTELLPREEPFAGRMVGDRLRDAGVRLFPGRSIIEVGREDPRDTGVRLPHGGEVTVWLDDGSTLVCDELVLATGRTPNTQDLGRPSVGCPPDGFLEVDDEQTVRAVSGLWLYAVGDVCGRALLTHMGKYQARVAGEVIAARATGHPAAGAQSNARVAADGHRGNPQVTFTDPEVGSAGMTEWRARQAGLDVATVEYDMAALAGTYVMRDDYLGRAKLVIDRVNDTVVGATFVGSGVADLVHSATMAIVARVPLSVLWHVVPSYPTASEVWLRLLETYRAQSYA